MKASNYSPSTFVGFIHSLDYDTFPSTPMFLAVREKSRLTSFKRSFITADKSIHAHLQQAF